MSVDGLIDMSAAGLLDAVRSRAIPLVEAVDAFAVFIPSTTRTVGTFTTLALAQARTEAQLANQIRLSRKGA